MILSRIKKTWEAHKKKQKQNQFVRGYDYAMGALIRKEETPISLESYYWDSTKNYFDLGIGEAINDSLKLSPIKDDRL